MPPRSSASAHDADREAARRKKEASLKELEWDAEKPQPAWRRGQGADGPPSEAPRTRSAPKHADRALYVPPRIKREMEEGPPITGCLRWRRLRPGVYS